MHPNSTHTPVTAGNHSSVHNDSQSEFRFAKKVIAGLSQPVPSIYWTDFLLSSILGWIAFGLTCRLHSISLLSIATGLLSILALYRALAFIHELTHLKAHSLPGFKNTWDMLIGIPLLFPSCVHINVHLDHHRVSTYGTDRDPEYLPFGSSTAMISKFIFMNALLPVLLLIRFLILSPIALIYPAFHSFLEKNATALAMNPLYKRRVSEAERKEIKEIEIKILIFWAAIILMTWKHFIPWQAFPLWCLVLSVITTINALRTLVSHRYHNDGRSLNRESQILDSIDIPGNLWTSIWAPVGLNYHALHHYFPNIPYHNLAKARRKLLESLPRDSIFSKSEGDSFYTSFQVLWKDASLHKKHNP